MKPKTTKTPQSETPHHPIGILGVVQTPFTDSGEIDLPSLERLVEDATDEGVDGFLVPAVASEAAQLSLEERIFVASRVSQITAGRVPVIWGTGSFEPEICVRVAQAALESRADACLVGISPELYRHQERILPFFADLAAKVDLPLMIQDWDPGGEGMKLDVITELYAEVETFRYLKVETIPAGPKYTAVLKATGKGLHVSGGWAVQQMIEALDRGVHAMIPECSMIRLYKKIDRLYRTGDREGAKNLFHRLLPVLCFTNQRLDISIRFFKKLLKRKGIFRTDRLRMPCPVFDSCSNRIADELMELVIALEEEVAWGWGRE